MVNFVRPDYLSDYQIAEAFGCTLSLIYKDKIEEIHEELGPVYVYLDTLDVPRFTDFDRSFARRTLQPRAIQLMQAIKHINKIRDLYRKVKNMPVETQKLDVPRARAVPIETLYDFKKRGHLVSCPFHGPDRNPSMSLRNNRFHCFTCQSHGDAIAFMMKLHDMDFKKAVEYLCQK